MYMIKNLLNSTTYWNFRVEDEDDLITMSNEEEFQEALKNVSDGLLRIFVKRSL